MSSKKPRAKPTAPQAVQLDAVRKLARAGDAAQAHSRLAALRRNHPDFKPLHGLAWEVEFLTGNDMLAAARALDWLTVSPKSRAAAEALRDSALAAGLGALALRTAQRIRELDGEPPAPVEPMPSPFGPLDLEQAAAIDLSRMHLEDGRHDRVIAVLSEVDHPSARNNLALALFSSGDVQQALDRLEANWRAEPGNLFALERVVRWRCWRDGMGAAAGFVEPLEHTEAQRAEDAIARVSALLFLHAGAAADAAWRAADDADYWEFATEAQRAQFDHQGACAAVKVGVHADAMARLNRALDSDPEHAPSLALLGQIDSGKLTDANELEVGETALWFPTAWIARLRQAARTARADPVQAMAPIFDDCDAHANYLGQCVEFGAAMMRELAVQVLLHRGQSGDAAAVAELKALLERPCGPDAVRMRIGGWLADNGFRDAKQPLQMWVKGSLREIKSHGIEISGRPRPSPFPPEGVALEREVHAALAHGALPEALELALRLQQHYPGLALPLTHVATIRSRLGHPAEEVESLYRRAHELDADNVFARCGLAHGLIARGRLEEAQALLDGLLERDSMHPSEYGSLLNAQRSLAKARNDVPAEEAASQALQALEEEFGRVK